MGTENGKRNMCSIVLPIKVNENLFFNCDADRYWEGCSFSGTTYDEGRCKYFNCEECENIKAKVDSALAYQAMVKKWLEKYNR